MIRSALLFTVAAVAIALPLQLARAGDDAPAPETAATESPERQLLGDWRLGTTLRMKLFTRGGAVYGRATRTGRIGSCQVRRGAILLRGLTFSGREGTADVWEGSARWPGSDCRRRTRRARVTQASELALELRIARAGSRSLRRVSPRVRGDDPVLGVWERRGGEISIALEGDRYVGRVHRAFLLSNGCELTVGMVVWRLRPSAPERYGGVTRTFDAPPECAPAGTAASQWRLEADGGELVRESPDGSRAEYHRVR